jgi:hypothetical protein
MKNDTTLIILVENKMPNIYDLFIQTRNRAIEMSKGTLKPNFEDFCKGLICEQDMLLSFGQIVFGKEHLTHGKKNPYKGPKKDTKPNVPSTSNNISNYDNVGALQKKEWKPCKYYEKTNDAEKMDLRGHNELAKAKKKFSKE